MPVFELFSKQQKISRGEVPDVYIYDSLPNTFRTQVVHIINDAIGYDKTAYDSEVSEVYKEIHDILRREYGVFDIYYKNYEGQDQNSVVGFFLRTEDVEKGLDVIQLCFNMINNYIRNNISYREKVEPKITSDEAVEELNQRFKEHGIGYQFVEIGIIKVDSTYTHSEIVKPTISLLWNEKFEGANEEYLKAHEHYRHGRNKECLTECLKAFESAMKVICIEKGWAFNQTDTAKKLIQICFANNLIPSFTQNQFTSLQNLLESGIPTIRNKLGGHGQGQVPQKVDDEMTRYGLNLTGTNVIFLVEQSGIK